MTKKPDRIYMSEADVRREREAEQAKNPRGIPESHKRPTIKAGVDQTAITLQMPKIRISREETASDVHHALGENVEDEERQMLSAQIAKITEILMEILNKNEQPSIKVIPLWKKLKECVSVGYDKMIRQEIDEAKTIASEIEELLKT